MNSSGTSNNVSSTVGVLKMHTSGNGTTHKIQIQASGSPQIIAASPTAISAPTPQVCLDHAGYNSDVDVRRCSNVLKMLFLPIFYLQISLNYFFFTLVAWLKILRLFFCMCTF